MPSWHDTVDRYGLDKELVYLSYNYFDRYMNLYRGTTPVQCRLISIACLLVAIKAKLSNEEAVVVNDIVNDMTAQEEIENIDLQALSTAEKDVPRALAWYETDIPRALEWYLNPPTMHQFAKSFFLLHPLTAAGDDFHAGYLLDATLFQVERALVQAEVMMNSSPSYIAFAAMIRAQEELDDSVLTPEMRDEFEELMNVLELCDRGVLEMRCALENSIPRLPTIDEYMDMRERGESAAAAIEQDEAAAAARMSPDNLRPDSPNNVAVF
ncbi:hypothetical protein ACHAXA_008342 [Cyclostephanos tholiformis]|uniref:Cyclin N-terminal domain-containing protein n=1 Tax=Cyclostephanos tholiformis TaxID=382380 RepID=A0ABD3R720_9STRA